MTSTDARRRYFGNVSRSIARAFQVSTVCPVACLVFKASLDDVDLDGLPDPVEEQQRTGPSGPSLEPSD